MCSEGKESSGAFRSELVVVNEANVPLCFEWWCLCNSVSGWLSGFFADENNSVELSSYHCITTLVRRVCMTLSKFSWLVFFLLFITMFALHCPSLLQKPRHGKTRCFFLTQPDLESFLDATTDDWRHNIRRQSKWRVAESERQESSCKERQGSCVQSLIPLASVGRSGDLCPSVSILG